MQKGNHCEEGRGMQRDGRLSWREHVLGLGLPAICS